VRFASPLGRRRGPSAGDFGPALESHCRVDATMLASSILALSAGRKPASMSVRWKDGEPPSRDGGPSRATAATCGGGCVCCCGNCKRSLRRRGLPGRLDTSIHWSFVMAEPERLWVRRKKYRRRMQTASQCPQPVGLECSAPVRTSGC
jgi:hypothetical protein